MRFRNTDASFSVWLNRVENQNHTLSLLNGPPSDSFRSTALTILLGVGRPAARSSSEKLSPCKAPFVKVKNVELVKRLPPSLGTKLMRTPPVGKSAESELVSTVTSAAEPTSGV